MIYNNEELLQKLLTVKDKFINAHAEAYHKCDVTNHKQYVEDFFTLIGDDISNHKRLLESAKTKVMCEKTAREAEEAKRAEEAREAKEKEKKEREEKEKAEKAAKDK